MSDQQAPVTIPEGQTPTTPDAGIPVVAPEGVTGQGPTTQQPAAGQAPGPPAPDDSVFFDPNEVSPELMPAYKQMQGAFTKKMQGLSTHRQKVEAYDAFMADPVSNLQRMATQYGLNLSRAEVNQAMGNTQPQPAEPWQPQTYEEIVERAVEVAERRVMQGLAPLLSTVQQVQATNIEKQLQDIDPTWRTYEDTMREKLKKHPTLVNDVSELYRLSVPEEVYQAKATQTALKKLQGKTQAAQVADKGTTSRSAPAPRKASSFAEAIEIAKETLAQQGR